MVRHTLLAVQGAEGLPLSLELMSFLVVVPLEDCSGVRYQGFNLGVRAGSSGGEGSCEVIHVAPGHNVTPGLRGDDNIV